MLDELFDELDKIIDDTKTAGDVKLAMPERPPLKVTSVVDTNTPKEPQKPVKIEFRSNKNYFVDGSNRTINIKGVTHKIEWFYNLENALKDDFKTLDYIFYHLGYEYKDFINN